MAISVENQFYFSMSIASIKDIIKEESDLREFTIIEKAGNELPSFLASFSTSNEEMITLLNDGNAIKVKLGTSREDADDFELMVTDLSASKRGETEFEINITGVLHRPKYINSAQVRCTDPISGVEGLALIARENKFNFKSNIESSRDKQSWVQYGVSPKILVEDMWLHSFVPNSFISMALSVNGDMIVKDVKKEVKSKVRNADWNFVKRKSQNKNNSVLYTNGYSIKNRSGLMNSWVTNCRQRAVDNLTTGGQELVCPTLEPILSLNSELIANSGMTSKFAGSNIISGSNDDNYWLAYQNNVANLALLSTFCLVVPCGDGYFPIRPLDIINFKETALDKELKSSEYLSGLYISTKVIRTIKGKQLATYVELCREAPNIVRNNAT